jgi:hypothetical protein
VRPPEVGNRRRLDGNERRLDGNERRLDGNERRLDGNERPLDGNERRFNEGGGEEWRGIAGVRGRLAPWRYVT